MYDERGDEDDMSNDDLHDPLDQQPIQTKGGLSKQEIRNVVLLFILYFVHAIPLGFSWVTMPILLKEQLSYSDVGTFLISQYPYSFKVAWSPLIESLCIPAFGRRKTWIVPCFLIVSVGLLWLAMTQDQLLVRIQAGEGFAMATLVFAWLVVTFMGANIRVAIDGWALDLLSQENVHWTGTATTVGEIAAMFVAFQGFLGLSSFSAQEKTDASTKTKPVSTRLFYLFSAALAVLTAIGLAIAKREKPSKSARSIRKTYGIIFKILRLPQVWILMLVHMTSMIGFQTNDSITMLQLVKFGFSHRTLAVIATISFPFDMAAGIYTSKFFRTQHPLSVWRKIFPWRLIMAFISQIAILFVSLYSDRSWTWAIILLPGIASNVLGNAMFVALMAFHAKVSDPEYGGIYLPLLATTLNIRYDALQFIFTKTIGWIDGTEDVSSPASLRLIDGYQIVNAVSIMVAIPVFVWFMYPATVWLQNTDPQSWRVSKDMNSDQKEYEMHLVDDASRLED